MATAFIIAGAVVLIALIITWMYNGLVRARNLCSNAWSQIEVQLERRYDLIPNLVETVKGYAAHERNVFEAVTQARSHAIDTSKSGSPAQRADAENALTGTLKTLFAVAEAYPDLKANQNFLALQEELTSTEDRVAYARQFYNDAVLRYNNEIQTLPRNLIAGPLHCTTRELFTTEPQAQAPIAVRF